VGGPLGCVVGCVVGGCPWVGYLVLALLAAVVVGVVVLGVRRSLPWGLPWCSRCSGRCGRGGAPVVSGATRPKVAVSQLEEAARFAAEARHREAVGCLYRALVGALAKSELVDEVSGRTTGDHEHLGASVPPGAARSLSTLTRMFELYWCSYGEAGAGAEQSLVACHGR